MQNISECTFPGCFPGVSWVFPGTFFFLFYFVKNLHNFCKRSFFLNSIPLIQNISNCTFPWCFPGVSQVFPRCFPGVCRVFLSIFLLPFTQLKIPTTFAEEVFFLNPASLIQNISKCTFPRCFLGVFRVFPGIKNSRSSLQYCLAQCFSMI